MFSDSFKQRIKRLPQKGPPRNDFGGVTLDTFLDGKQQALSPTRSPNTPPSHYLPVFSLPASLVSPAYSERINKNTFPKFSSPAESISPRDWRAASPLSQKIQQQHHNTPKTSLPLKNRKRLSHRDNLAAETSSHLASPFISHDLSTSSKSSLFEDSGSAKGPKVKPYSYSQSAQPLISVLPLTTCPVCDEHLSQRLKDELLVILTDKRVLHFDCIQLLVTSNVKNAIAANALSTALLSQDWSDQAFASLSAPADPDIKESLLSQARSQYEPELGPDTNLPRLLMQQLLLSTNISRLATTLDRGYTLATDQPPPSTPFSVFNTSSPKADSKDNLPGLGLWFSQDSTPTRHRASRVRSTASVAFSSSASSQSLSPTLSVLTLQTFSANIAPHRGVPPETLRTAFITHLLESCPSLPLAHLVKLGELRLVDNLESMIEGDQHMVTRTVYLFDYYVLVVIEGSATPVQFELQLAAIAAVETQLELTVSNGSRLFLQSDDDIIEKWVVAVCDRSFIFPVEFISSSITLPQFETDAAMEPGNSVAEMVRLLSRAGRESRRVSRGGITRPRSIAEVELNLTPDSPDTIIPPQFAAASMKSRSETSVAGTVRANLPSPQNGRSPSFGYRRNHSNNSFASNSKPCSTSEPSTDFGLDVASDSDSDAEVIGDALQGEPLSKLGHAHQRLLFVAESNTGNALNFSLNLKRPVKAVDSPPNSAARKSSSQAIPKELGWDDLVAKVDQALTVDFS